MSFFYNQNSGVNRDGNAMVWYLILANVVAFLFSNRLEDMAMYCNKAFFRLWQPLTAGFLHGDFWHLLFNMYGIFLFGTLVAPHIGKRNFFYLYVISALCGNLLYLCLNWGSNTVVVGSSGALFGIMAAAALLEPEKEFSLLLLPTKPLKTTSMVICFALIEIVLQFIGSQKGVAHLAHLGGLVGGYLFIRFGFPKQVAWDIFRKQVRDVPPREPPREGPRRTGRVTSAELDELLDKVSRYGINSLSEHELARLRQAREEMRGK